MYVQRIDQSIAAAIEIFCVAFCSSLLFGTEFGMVSMVLYSVQGNLPFCNTFSVEH